MMNWRYDQNLFKGWSIVNGWLHFHEINLLYFHRKDQDKLEKINAFREAIKRVRIGADQMPTVCFYSIVNAHQG